MIDIMLRDPTPLEQMKNQAWFNVSLLSIHSPWYFTNISSDRQGTWQNRAYLTYKHTLFNDMSTDNTRIYNDVSWIFSCVMNYTHCEITMYWCYTRIVILSMFHRYRMIYLDSVLYVTPSSQNITVVLTTTIWYDIFYF